MEYLSEFISFLIGLAGGSLLTLAITKKTVSSGGKLVDQQSAKAGGNIVGGDYSVGKEPDNK